jgi:hypothetical protein
MQFSDNRVTSLSQKIFLTSNQSDNLRLLLQLSVTEGVQDMYTHFYNYTKQQVNLYFVTLCLQFLDF